MKTHALFLSLPVCLVAMTTAAWGIRLGDARDDVLAELGTPTATTVLADGVEALAYPSGEVRLRGGVVCHVLLTDSGDERFDTQAPDLAVQMQIAELEARLAAMRAQLARAEAELQAVRASSSPPHWARSTTAPRDPALATPFRTPARRAPAAADAVIFVTASSGL